MELALFTGKPHFAIPQHVGGPIVEPETRERFHRLADEAFERNHLTNDGPLLRRLEEEIAARHRVGHAVLSSNATMALMVLLKAMGLDKGEAVVAANTFISTPHMCEWQGLRVRFADIDPATLNLDVADMERKIGPDTRVVVPTHVFGAFSDMPAILKAAEKRGVKVLADAAHAFDCDRGGVRAGGFGVPEFISLHATKFFSAIEGGAVVTNDGALAAEMRAVRNFGYDRPMDAGKLGVNAKLSEIHAAFGLASLPALEERRNLLREIRDAYVARLVGIPGLRIHPLDRDGGNNYRYFALFIEPEFGLSRDEVFQALGRENILIRLYFHPGCQRNAYYRDSYPDTADSLTGTDKALDAILCLPTSFVGVEPIRAAKDIAALLETLHGNAEKVGAALRAR